MKKWIYTMIAVAAAGCHRPAAQPVSGIEYTTEIQTDCRDLNWVNLLKINFPQTLCNGVRLNIGSISIAKTRPERLVNDWQVFSNIEEENLPFSLRSGSVVRSGASFLFAGIRT